MHIALNAQLLSLSQDYRAAGINWYIHNLLAHLPEDGHRYTVFLRERRAEKLFPHLRARVARWPTRNPLARILWEQFILPFHLQAGIDLVHSLAFAMPIFSPIPAVVTIYDLSFMLYPKGLNPFRRLYLDRMTRLSARKARAIIAISNSTKEDIERLLGVEEGKTTVTLCGVDEHFHPLGAEAVSEFRHKRGLPERFILFVGTLEKRKNLSVLLSAYAKLKRDIPHTLVLAGAPGWGVEEVMAQIERLGLKDRIVLPGYIPSEELVFWYNACDLFVYPSLYEGFGLPPLEVMACGVPVIASNTSSLPEVVGDAGLLADPRDEKAWAQAILEVLRDQSLREKLQARGRERAKGFSWEEMARETVQVYERAIGSRDV